MASAPVNPYIAAVASYDAQLATAQRSLQAHEAALAIDYANRASQETIENTQKNIALYRGQVNRLLELRAKAIVDRDRWQQDLDTAGGRGLSGDAATDYAKSKDTQRKWTKYALWGAAALVLAIGLFFGIRYILRA